MTIYAFIGEALLGWLLADLISGLLHWIGDSEVLGRSRLVRFASGFNTDHHADPLAITREPFLKRQATQLVGIAIIGGTWLALAGFSILLMFTVLGGLVIAEAHRWAHLPGKVGPVVKMMQEIGLLQSPGHHSRHHRPPHQCRYCVLTNWLNPVLDMIGLWRFLDRIFK